MAVGTNMMLAYNDYAQSGSVYANSAAMNPAYPLSNALLPDLFQPAIFVNNGSTIQFTIDLGSQKVCSLIALLKHNLNYASKWRIYLNADIVNDPLGNEYDSGWMLAIPTTPSYGSLPWGQFNWGDAIPEYNLGVYNRHAYWPLPATVAFRYLTIGIDAAANPSPIEFFRLWASLGYQPSVNVMYGAKIIPQDETKMVKSASGVKRYGPPVQLRTLQAGFDLLPRSEMLYNILGGIYLASGIRTPIIGLLEPADPANYYTEAVYGNLQQIDGVSYDDWLRFATTFQIEEQP